MKTKELNVLILDEMIECAKKEANDSWEVAKKTARTTEWAQLNEAKLANPGFSFVAFWKNNKGNWCCG